jgi:hypothetical protein
VIRVLLKLVIKIAVQEPMLPMAWGYQVNSVVLSELKPRKLMYLCIYWYSINFEIVKSYVCPSMILTSFSHDTPPYRVYLCFYFRVSHTAVTPHQIPLFLP